MYGNQAILLNRRKLMTTEKRLKSLQEAEKQAEEEAMLKEEKLEKDSRFEVSNKNKKLILKINEATLEDAAIYIVRHNYTFKKQLNMIQRIYDEKRLPNTAIVINDVKPLAGYGEYYGYVNYGYKGYGYGYGKELSNYFDVKEKRGFVAFVRKVFGV